MLHNRLCNMLYFSGYITLGSKISKSLAVSCLQVTVSDHYNMLLSMLNNMLHNIGYIAKLYNLLKSICNMLVNIII